MQWLTHYIEHRNGREAQILAVLRKAPAPLRSMEIVKILYKARRARSLPCLRETRAVPCRMCPSTCTSRRTATCCCTFANCSRSTSELAARVRVDQWLK